MLWKLSNNIRKKDIFPILTFLWLLYNLLQVYFIKNGKEIYKLESAFIIMVFAIVTTARFFKEDSTSHTIFFKPTYLITVASALWIYSVASSLHLPFLSDDLVFAMKFSDWANIFSNETFFRPLFNLIFSLIYNLTGGKPLVFHLLSLSLHLGISLIVKNLFTRIFKDESAGIAGFCIYILNPLQSESVLWISGLQELMWSCFILLGIRELLINGFQINIGSIKLLILTLCGLLSKETAISFVALYLFLDIYLNSLKGLKKTWKFHLTSTGIGIAYFLIRSTLVTSETSHLFSPNLYLFKSILIAPYRKLFTPWNSLLTGNLFYLKILITLALVSLLLFIVIRHRSIRTVLLGAAVIMASSLPVNRMLFIGDDLQGSRYLYFPYIGATIIIISLIKSMELKDKAMSGLLLSLILFSGITLSINVLPWIKAGKKMNEIKMNLKKGSKIEPIPDNYKGAYILRNGLKELKILTEASEKKQ